MTPGELREAIRRAAQARDPAHGWIRRLADAADVEYNNLAIYLRGGSRSATGAPKDLTVSQLLKIGNVIGLTISVSDKPESGREVQGSASELAMQEMAAPDQSGGPHGGAVSAEDIATAVARAVASGLADRIERAVERLASGERVRPKAPERIARSRKGGR